MARQGFADIVRDCHAIPEVERARSMGETEISFRVGDVRAAVRRLLPEKGIKPDPIDAYDICQALRKNRVFDEKAGVEFLDQSGTTTTGLDAVLRFRIK